LILSSAITRCEALVTEDRHIRSAALNGGFIEMREALSPKFRFYSMDEILGGEA